MKKLRLTAEEWEDMLKDISMKFHEDCNRNISNFSYTKTDVDKFLKESIDKKVKKPVIEITADAYAMMYELVKQSSVEIQWHGLVKHSFNVYTIYDILVFPQINSAASTSSNQDEFAEWQTELIMDSSFPLEEMRMHGHSHVNMNVYSSSIDDGYQSELITKVDDDDYYIFLVLNKKMEMYPILYDFKQQILFEGNNDIKVEIIGNHNLEIKAWATDQIEEFCKTANIPTWKTNIKERTGFDFDTQPDDYISQLVNKPRGIKRR